MLIDGEDQAYFADRDNAIFRARGLTFPYRKNPSEHLADTLVDGVRRAGGTRGRGKVDVGWTVDGTRWLCGLGKLDAGWTCVRGMVDVGWTYGRGKVGAGWTCGHDVGPCVRCNHQAHLCTRQCRVGWNDVVGVLCRAYTRNVGVAATRRCVCNCLLANELCSYCVALTEVS